MVSIRPNLKSFLLSGGKAHIWKSGYLICNISHVLGFNWFKAARYLFWLGGCVYFENKSVDPLIYISTANYLHVGSNRILLTDGGHVYYRVLDLKD